MRALVQFSGGVGSWMATGRAIERFGPDEVELLFADTKMEDEDLYRFLDDAERQLGVPLHRIADGRTPWQVFADKRFLGNPRVDLCSRVLKRELLRAWIDENCDINTLVVFGIDWTEQHRIDRAAPRWDPYRLWAPLCDPPYLDKGQMLDALVDAGIEPPRLYTLGFPHNNCGGFCVKAGQAQFDLLLRVMPERYGWHETQEEQLRAELGKPVAVMVDRRGGGPRRPLTMRQFRERRLAVDPNDWSGCGCAVD
jgi:hypothetical protein